MPLPPLQHPLPISPCAATASRDRWYLARQWGGCCGPAAVGCAREHVAGLRVIGQGAGHSSRSVQPLVVPRSLRRPLRYSCCCCVINCDAHRRCYCSVCVARTRCHYRHSRCCSATLSTEDAWACLRQLAGDYRVLALANYIAPMRQRPAFDLGVVSGTSATQNIRSKIAAVAESLSPGWAIAQ